jgi:hypothetical protein
MDEAILHGMLKDEAIEHHRSLKQKEAERLEIQKQVAYENGWMLPAPNSAIDPQSYCKLLASTFPRLRNHYAHGSPTVTWTIGLTFSLCRDLIDQLYPT